MAFSTGSNGGGRTSRRFHGTSALSDINVTPFVDVLLVVLIIFMMTAHVMEFGIEVDVPEVKTTRDSTKELPVVTITREGTLYLGDKTVNINQLGDIVKEKYGKGQAVYLRADKQTIYDPIAQVLSALGDAGIAVNMVTKPEESGGRKR